MSKVACGSTLWGSPLLSDQLRQSLIVWILHLNEAALLRWDIKSNNIKEPIMMMKLCNRPGRLLRLFLEPKSLTREKTFSRLGFSQFPLVLLGLLTQRQALVFSRSLACLFCLMRELAIAAAMASLAAVWEKLPKKKIWIQKTGSRSLESRRSGNVRVWSGDNDSFVRIEQNYQEWTIK